MNKTTARTVQGTVQFLFHTVLVMAFFFVPSIVEGLIFGFAA
jgi:hypothetical protein